MTLARPDLSKRRRELLQDLLEKVVDFGSYGKKIRVKDRTKTNVKLKRDKPESMTTLGDCSREANEIEQQRQDDVRRNQR